MCKTGTLIKILKEKKTHYPHLSSLPSPWGHKKLNGILFMRETTLRNCTNPLGKTPNTAFHRKRETSCQTDNYYSLVSREVIKNSIDCNYTTAINKIIKYITKEE